MLDRVTWGVMVVRLSHKRLHLFRQIHETFFPSHFSTFLPRRCRAPSHTSARLSFVGMMLAFQLEPRHIGCYGIVRGPEFKRHHAAKVAERPTAANTGVLFGESPDAAGG